MNIRFKNYSESSVNTVIKGIVELVLNSDLSDSDCRQLLRDAFLSVLQEDNSDV